MSRPTLPGIAAIFDVDRPVLGNRRRYGHIEGMLGFRSILFVPLTAIRAFASTDELRALIPGCDPTGSLRLLSDPIFRQFKLEEQVHAFVKTFVQQVYGELPGRHVESARNYVVRPEFLICLNLPAPGSNASKMTAHHPHFRQIRHPGRASSAFVAGGARAVSWRLIDRDAYLTPDPVNLPSMHWYLDFDFEIPGDQQRRVVKWYFEIVFTKGLQELQDEVVDRERMAA
ncbi:hypothetical protein JCM11641_003378, partial [Rhodosporidiobolus odoratus]